MAPSTARCLWAAPGARNVFLAVLLFSSSASSQTIELGLARVSRDAPRFDRAVNRSYYLNRNDCLTEDVFHFRLRLQDNAGLGLTGWVTHSNADCAAIAARTSGSRDCWMVFFQTLPAEEQLVDVRVQDMAIRPTDRPGTGTPEGCLGAGQPDSAPQRLQIWFMHVVGDAQSQARGEVTGLQTLYDLIPPGAPSAIMKGTEESLLVGWSPPRDSDVAGYRLYCDPARGQPSPTAGGAAGGGSDDPQCRSSALSMPAVSLLDANLCGVIDSPSVTEAVLSGLHDGQSYAVAVAAYDEAGNIGALSNVVCGTPRNPHGIVDIAGRGGCGCRIAAARGPTSSPWLCWLWGGLAIASLLRRSRVRRTIEQGDCVHPTVSPRHDRAPALCQHSRYLWGNPRIVSVVRRVRDALAALRGR
jgi:hypothetical protein